MESRHFDVSDNAEILYLRCIPIAIQCRAVKFSIYAFTKQQNISPSYDMGITQKDLENRTDCAKLTGKKILRIEIN